MGYEAIEKKLEVGYVKRSRTSSTCPRYGDKLKKRSSRIPCYPSCGFIGDRDTCINLFLKYSRCRIPGLP